MSLNARVPGRPWFRLWSALLFLGAMRAVQLAVQGGELHHALLGAGLLLGSVFAFRHDLLDLSPRALDPRRIGTGWTVLLAASGLLIVVAAGLVLMA